MNEERLPLYRVMQVQQTVLGVENRKPKIGYMVFVMFPEWNEVHSFILEKLDKEKLVEQVEEFIRLRKSLEIE